MFTESEMIPDWSRALDKLLGGREKILARDKEFMENVFDPDLFQILPDSPMDRISMLKGEAEKALLMIEPHLSRGERLLEIGGGVGLVYSMLRSKGFDIISLEPGAAGFGNRYEAGRRLLRMLEIDQQGWLNTGIENFQLDHCKFNLIFSYFVLEHIPDQEKAFGTMAKAMDTCGLMIHCCPNYTIPFEPHFNIPLIPLKPRWTSLLYPSLHKNGLWKGLSFTTVKSLSELCKRHGLIPAFQRGMTARYLERVLTDHEFSVRKKGLVRPAKYFKKTGLLNLIRRLPPFLDTPLQFTATKKPGYNVGK